MTCWEDNTNYRRHFVCRQRARRWPVKYTLADRSIWNFSHKSHFTYCLEVYITVNWQALSFFSHHNRYTARKITRPFNVVRHFWYIYLWGGIFLELWSSQMPFLTPPVTHTGLTGNWTQVSRQQPVVLRAELWLLLCGKKLVTSCTVTTVPR